MSTSKTEMTTPAQATPAEPAVVVTSKKGDSILDKALALLSSVRFGLVMLGLLLTCCMIGMLIMQINVEGFDKYYQQLTPAKRDLYQVLGFFNIYHSWYFSLLLAVTGLNIILASIDRFPTAWQYFAKPKLEASPKFIAAQMFNAQSEAEGKPLDVAQKVRSEWRRLGFRSRISEGNDRVTVFAQRNVWNRFGAYVVHVALLTIFIGGFMTNRFGLGGQMQITPGMDGANEFMVTEFGQDGKPKVSKAFLPFKIECRDIQQKLVRPEGGLDGSNTIDWLSYITIVDGNERQDLDVHLNHVGDYNGYRFFQSMFDPTPNARQVTVIFKPADQGPAQEVTLLRNEVKDVEGIGRVFLRDFVADYTDASSREYSDYTAADLGIVLADGKRARVAAFSPKLIEDARRMAEQSKGQEINEYVIEINGKKYSAVLKDFEKVSSAHTLTVQYDPGRTPVYMGFLLLSVALCGVFFFAHQRVWAVIEPAQKGSKIYFGGNTNRNRPAFEGRFKTLVNSVTGGGIKDE